MSVKRLMWGCGVVLLTVGLLGCSDDGTSAGGGESNAVSLISAQNVQSAKEAAEAVDKGNAAVTPADKARLGAVPASQTGNQDLGVAVVGSEATMDFDIDGDGSDNSVYVFTKATEPITFLIWDKEETCHIAWEEEAVAYQIQRGCGGTGDLIACSHPVGSDVFACNVCRTGAPCEACEVNGTTVDCPEEEVDDAPNNAPNNQPNNDAPLCDPPCGSGELCVDGVCQEVDQPDPVAQGECSESCLSQSLAVCCTTCGCEGEVICEPQCGSGFSWDCEIGCCFNYDSLECACPEGAQWDGEQFCCAVDGECQ